MQVFDLPEPKDQPRAVAFSPDGLRLGTWSQGQVTVLDATSGAVFGAFGERATGIHAIVAPNTVPAIGFGADGRTVVVHRSAGVAPARAYALSSGELLRECPALDQAGAAVAPDGRLWYLATRSGRHTEVARWDPRTGETLPAFGRYPGGLSQLAVSPDERWMAGADGREVRVWNLGRADPLTRAVRRFGLNIGGPVGALALSAGGDFVAHCGTAIGFGDMRDGSVWTVAEPSVRTNRGVAFHPTQPVLMFTYGTAEVALYDPGARRTLKRYAWGVGAVTAVTFSPDGLRGAAVGTGKVVVWDVDV